MVEEMEKTCSAEVEGEVPRLMSAAAVRSDRVSIWLLRVAQRRDE
jgi:hypothetical protein